MSLLPLHLLGSPVLRERSAEVSAIDDEVRQFVDDLFETMHAAKGVGLAANQVGVARRVAVVETEDEKLVLINPVILDAEGRDTAEEGCLSIPKVYADVTRPEQSRAGSHGSRRETATPRRSTVSPPGRSSTKSTTSMAFSSWITSAS